MKIMKITEEMTDFGSFRAPEVILYTLVEVNVTRPMHKMRSDSRYWCEEALRIFKELGETFWEGRAALMPLATARKEALEGGVHLFSSPFSIEIHWNSIEMR